MGLQLPQPLYTDVPFSVLSTLKRQPRFTRHLKEEIGLINRVSHGPVPSKSRWGGLWQDAISLIEVGSWMGFELRGTGPETKQTKRDTEGVGCTVWG